MSTRSVERIDQIIVEVDMAEEIDFVGSRLTRSAWPELAFGMLGRAAERNARDNSDRDVAKQVSVGAKLDVIEVLMGTLKEDLMETGKVGSAVISKKGSPSEYSNTTAAHLYLSIPSWGLKRIGDEGMLKTFLDANLEFIPSAGSSRSFTDHQVITLDATKGIDAYKNDKESLGRDICALIAAASKRIVSVIIR